MRYVSGDAFNLYQDILYAFNHIQQVAVSNPATAGQKLNNFIVCNNI